MLSFLKLPLKSLGRTFTSALNITLSLILFTQILLYATGVNQNTLISTNTLQTQLNSILEKYDLSIELDSIELNSRGSIHIHSGEVFSTLSPSPVATFDHLEIELKLLPLLFKKVEIKSIDLQDGTLYCPPAYSPTGINEPILTNIHGLIAPKRDFLEIEHLVLKFGTLTAVLQGRTPLSTLLPSTNPTNKKATPPNFQKIFTSLSQVLDARKHLALTHKPQLEITLSPSKNLNSLNIGCRAFLESLKIEDSLLAHKVSLEGTLKYKDEQLSIHTPLSLNADQLSFQGEYTAQALWASLYFDQLISQKSLSLLPYSIELYASEISTPHFKNAALHTQFKPLKNKVFQGHLTLTRGHSLISLEGSYDHHQKALQANSEGQLAPELLLPLLATQKLPAKFPKITPKEPISFSADIQTGSNFAVTSIDGFVRSNNILLNQRPISSLSFDFTGCTEHINLHNINITGPNLFAQGNFLQDLTNHKYRFLLSGHAFPEDVDPFISKAWWQDLWQATELSKTPPYVDLDLSGNWSQQHQNRSFVQILASDFTYNQVPVDEAHLTVSSGPEFLNINVIEGTSEEGSFVADINWTYDPKESYDTTKIEFDGDTYFPLNNIAKIINKEPVTLALADFTCQVPPHIIASGTIYPKTEALNAYHVRFHSPTPVQYQDIPLDRLSFDSHSTHTLDTISNILFGFGSGRGYGTATMEKNSEQDKILNLNIQLADAQYDKFVDYLYSQGPESIQSKQNTSGGLLNLVLKASGNPQDLHSFTGTGSVTVRESDLGKIHVLGPLSRALAATPLGFSTLKLTDASSTFIIDKETISFPDIIIYGPSSNIQSSGTYHIPTYGLNFLLDIQTIGKKNIPLLTQAMALLNPIAQSFQVRLEGTVSEPDFDLKLTPFGLFKKTE